MNLRSRGTQGEDIAARFLVTAGWKIIGRNLHRRLGEIDILARDANSLAEELVIVEIKTKRTGNYGSAAEMITSAKKRTLRQLAKIVEQEYNKPVRIDVVAIDEVNSPNPIITHYPHAIEEI